MDPDHGIRAPTLNLHGSSWVAGHGTSPLERFVRHVRLNS